MIDPRLLATIFDSEAHPPTRQAAYDAVRLELATRVAVAFASHDDRARRAFDYADELLLCVGVNGQAAAELRQKSISEPAQRTEAR